MMFLVKICGLFRIAVNSLGHCHPKVVNAVCEQVKKLMHCSNLYYIKNQALLAQMICKNSVCDRVFYQLGSRSQ